MKLKQSSIYWIDKNFGRPLCFFLTLHNRIFNVFRNNSTTTRKPLKILFIKLLEQGSTVLAYSALKKAVGMVGKENVYFMVFKENRFILDILDIIQPKNIIEISSDSFGKFALSVLKSIGKIRYVAIDAVVDMEFFSRASAILSYLSGAEKRVGLHLFTSEGPYRGDLFTHKLLYNPYLHTSQFYLCLVEALNQDASSSACPMIFSVPQNCYDLPKFSASDDELYQMTRKIEKLKGAELTKPIIILNPNAGDMLPIRKWPEQYFIELGKLILKTYGNATIIISGASEEKEIVDVIAEKIGNALSLGGLTSLRDLLLLYCISDVLVTNDSGPAHFSALTPVYSVILYGPETPFLYGPLSKNAKVIAPNLVCSPCVNVYNHRKSPCNEGHCMRNIQVEQVYYEVNKFLTRVL